MNRNTILHIFFLLLLPFSSLADDYFFHRVPVKSGDNILRFLKRYDLHQHQCNFDKFYELNDLKSTSSLQKDRKYIIPVMIFKYNGVSIRSTLGIDKWETALSIKKYNEQIKKKKLRQSTLVKSNILWVPYHSVGCGKMIEKNKQLADKPSKTNPAETQAERQSREKKMEKVDEKVLAKNNTVSGYRKFPIFGKDNALIPLKDNKLRGKIYYVVSGHGGPDVGAVGHSGKNQLCEDEYAYDVSLRLARALLEHGALVYMIVRDPNDGLRSDSHLPCDYDEYCWGNYKIPRNQKSRLYQRSDAINKLYEYHKKQGIKDQNQTTIVIHIDSRGTSENTDVFFYYYPGSSRSRKLAKNIQNSLAVKYKKYRSNGKYNGTVSARDLHMVREPKTTSVFIELGNIRNKSDQRRFTYESNRQYLADWMYEGIVK